jgi:hypothetical protein
MPVIDFVPPDAHELLEPPESTVVAPAPPPDVEPALPPVPVLLVPGDSRVLLTLPHPRRKAPPIPSKIPPVMSRRETVIADTLLIFPRSFLLQAVF